MPDSTASSRTRLAVALAITFGVFLSSGPLIPVGAEPLRAQERPAVGGEDGNEGEAVVTGTVRDASTGAPLAQAMVSFEARDWGIFTDDNGRFRLEAGDMRRGTLLVEHLGYRTRRIPVEVEDGTGPVEVGLEPDPVLLEGLEVVTDRFQRRRNATATSVRAYGVRDLARSLHTRATDFLQGRAGVPIVNCPFHFVRFNCALVRGRTTNPSVYIDEAPAIGGLDELDFYLPGDLYLIEIYGHGRHIRAYTHHFMERAAKRRLQPIPIFF